MQKKRVALADDHALLRNGLAALIHSFEDYEVIFQASNGRELMEKLDPGKLPDIILMDINMPVMDGYETTHWLTNNFPLVNVLALSMYDNETAIIRMLKNGARGYILKNADSAELKKALKAVQNKGFYYSELVTGHLINSVHKMGHEAKTFISLNLNDRELEFLKHACSELSYKEIADLMYLSPRTIDGYRDALFSKLNIKSRVGLAIFAIKNGIVSV